MGRYVVVTFNINNNSKLKREFTTKYFNRFCGQKLAERFIGTNPSEFYSYVFL